MGDRALTERMAELTGRRFCNDHRGEASAEGGQYIVRNKITRWICQKCGDKRTAREKV